jgi:hypothetical protein
VQVLKLLKQIQLEERGEVEPPPIALPTAEDFDEDFDEDEDEEDEDDDDEEEGDSNDGRALPCCVLRWPIVLATYISIPTHALCHLWSCMSSMPSAALRR